MTYDVIEPPVDPNSIATDDRSDFEQAKTEWDEGIRTIHDAVEAFAEVLTDTDEDYHLRAVVPFRITGYRFDLLDDTIEDMDLRVPVDDTDGWRDLSDKMPTYRTFQFHHRDVRGADYVEMAKGHDDLESAKETIRSLCLRNLCEGVEDTLREGTVEQTIDGYRYEEVPVDEPAAAIVDDPADPSKPDDLFEEEKVEYPAGTATYRVDAIVTPESWENDL